MLANATSFLTMTAGMSFFTLKQTDDERIFDETVPRVVELPLACVVDFENLKYFEICDESRRISEYKIYSRSPNHFSHFRLTNE